MRIGIIGAMEEEVTAVKDRMKVERIEKKAGMEFYMGVFEEKEVVVVKSGIGKVNAAICTQILIDDFDVACVINTGVAGGVKDGLKPGDVIIASDLIQHDVDGTVCGYERGQVPRMSVVAFAADEKLSKLAEAAAEKIEEFRVLRGRIISGDQIIADSEKLKFFREKFGAYAVEMEGAAIGHVCFVNEIPFAVIRSISDSADENSNMDYDAFVNMAISNSIRILTDMIRNM